jgi:hypothetical protein
LVYRKVRPPTRKLKTTFKATRPNLFMWSQSSRPYFVRASSMKYC